MPDPEGGISSTSDDGPYPQPVFAFRSIKTGQMKESKHCKELEL
jgi:hypothetical protein